MIEENLIRAVERRPVLYDLSHKLYKNNGYRSKIWKEVSDELGVQSDECHKLWKRLREKYANYNKKPKSGSKAVSHCIKFMNFLKPYLSYPKEYLVSSYTTSEPEPSTSDDSTLHSFFTNFDPGDDSQFNNNGCFSSIQEADDIPIPGSSGIDETRYSTDSPTPSRVNNRFKRARHAENDSDIDKIINAIQAPVEEHDEVDLFCLSAAKDIKKMAPNEQRRIRFEISKLLLNASYDQ